MRGTERNTQERDPPKNFDLIVLALVALMNRFFLEYERVGK